MLETSQDLITEGDVGHCTRVAAYCAEISLELGFPEVLRDALYDAALRHHDGQVEADLKKLGFRLERSAEGTDLSPSLADQLLQARESGHTVNPQIKMALDCLEMADFCDETIEFSAYADQPRSSLFSSSSSQAIEAPPVAFVLSYLRGLQKADVEKLIPELPVMSDSALKVLRIAAAGEADNSELIQLAKSDQILAGAVLELANSATYARRDRTASIIDAVNLVGSVAALKVMVAAALRPLLRTEAMPDLWQHSQEAAQIAQEIATLTETISPEDAYTLGLLHDVGRLLFEIIPSGVRQRCHRLKKAGVQSAIAELLTCGITHAEASGAILRYWQLPDEYVKAVMHHHEPGHCDSALAALLYLVEFWTASDEDTPSAARLQDSLSRLGLTVTDSILCRKPEGSTSSSE
jgi:HD-like signal output (HDOD) protein